MKLTKARQSIQVIGEIYKPEIRFNLFKGFVFTGRLTLYKEQISFSLTSDSNANLIIRSGGLVYTWNSEKQFFQNNRQDRFVKLHLPYGSLLRLIQ